MTNTRITDAEILEQRYPVRVERFSIRRGSGGAGRHPGGDGLIRELCFLEPASLSELTQHRRVPPYGLGGGLPGFGSRLLLLPPEMNEATVDRGHNRPGGGFFLARCDLDAVRRVGSGD